MNSNYNRTLPHEMITKTLRNLPYQERIPLSRQLSRRFQSETKEERLNKLISTTITPDEINEYVNMGTSLVATFNNRLKSTLYFCLPWQSPIRLYISRVEQWDKLIIEEITPTCSIGKLDKLSELVRSDNQSSDKQHPLTITYDLLTHYYIFKKRANEYFVDITNEDIKSVLLRHLTEQYNAQDTITLIFLRTYLLFHCIIMNIKYGDVEDFLKESSIRKDPNKRSGIELEEKDLQILDRLYNLVVDGIQKLD